MSNNKQQEKEILNKQKPVEKTDSGYDLTYELDQPLSDNDLSKIESRFRGFMLNLKELSSPEKKKSAWMFFKNSFLYQKGELNKEVLKVVDKISSEAIESQFNEDKEGSLLLSVSDFCLEKEIIDDIISVYRDFNDGKEAKEFISKYVDRNGSNVLHHLAKSIVNKVTRIESVSDKDFEAYWSVLKMDIYLSGDEDNNQQASIDVIKSQTYNLEEYIDRTEKIIDEIERKEEEKQQRQEQLEEIPVRSSKNYRT